MQARPLDAMQPYAMVTIMFLGMAFCLPLSYLQQWQSRRRAAAADLDEVTKPLLDVRPSPDPYLPRMSAGKERMPLSYWACSNNTDTGKINPALATHPPESLPLCRSRPHVPFCGKCTSHVQAPHASCLCLQQAATTRRICCRRALWGAPRPLGVQTE